MNYCLRRDYLFIYYYYFLLSPVGLAFPTVCVISTTSFGVCRRERVKRNFLVFFLLLYYILYNLIRIKKNALFIFFFYRHSINKYGNYRAIKIFRAPRRRFLNGSNGLSATSKFTLGSVGHIRNKSGQKYCELITFGARPLIFVHPAKCTERWGGN